LTIFALPSLKGTATALLAANSGSKVPFRGFRGKNENEPENLTQR